MEGTHGKLCTGLTDGLSSDDTNCFTHLYRFAGSHVGSVTLRTDTHMGFTCKRRTDLDLSKGLTVFVYALFHDTSCTLRCDHMICFNDDFTVFIAKIFSGKTSRNTILQAFDFFFPVHECFYIHARDLIGSFAAIYFTNDLFLRYIHQTSCQVTGVCSTKSRIRQTFTCSVSRHEVFQYVQTFTEVGLDRKLDGVTGGICHQSTHTCQLFDLFIRTTGTGICHHVDVVVLIQAIQQCFCQDLVSLFPGVYYFFITLFFCDKTTLVVFGDTIHSILRLLDQFRLFWRNRHVGNGYCHSCSGRILISHRLDIIQNFRCLCSAMGMDDFFKDLFQAFFAYMEVYFQCHFILGVTSIYKAQVLRKNLVKDKPSHSGLHNALLCSAIGKSLFYSYFNPGLKSDHPVFIGKDCLIDTLKEFTFALCSRSFLGQVVDTKDHILRRNGHRATIGRLQQVVRRKQQETTLRLCFHGQGQMDCHLVAVEVCVKGCTYQRMQLDGLALYQDRLKCLNTQSVQCRSTV